MDAEPIRVLLIEDNPDYARPVCDALARVEGASFDVTWVDRLSAGLRRMAGGGTDLVLLDLMLPDSKGLETLAAARAQAPEVPVVVLTGFADDTLGVQAVQAGAQDYLIKGQADSTDLVRAMRYAIERHRLRAELDSLAMIDELTGLYNRRGFSTFARQLMKAANRAEKGLFLVFADLDGLKQINDAFGHQEGDQALVEVAGILRGTFRDSDVIARLGGDEFAILAISDSDEMPKAITARLQEKFKDYNARGNPGYTLSVSLGVVRCDPKSNAPLEELLARADQALYAQKRGRSKF